MFTPDPAIASFVPLSSHVDKYIIKTTGGDYITVWQLAGLAFVGRDEWELEHKHKTFNRLLQSLRAPDFTNVAFWVYDVRRKKGTRLTSKYQETFNQELSDKYYARLSGEKIMQNELYLTMIYRPIVEGKRLAEKTSDLTRLLAEEKQAINKLNELAINARAVLQEYEPRRLGIYEKTNRHGDVNCFSEALELYGFILNRLDEPVPVLNAPIYDYLPLSRHMFSEKTGDFIIRNPNNKNYYGALLNIKEYPESTYPGVLNNLKYLPFEYVITHSFTPKGRTDALKTLERTQGMMISSGDRSYSQIAQLNQAMDDLSSGNFVLGEYHLTMAIYAEDHTSLQNQLAATRAELSNSGFVSAKEDLAVSSAFYAQLPCNWKYRTRIANLSSLNFIGLSPLHNFASGKKEQNPWGECVSVLQTSNGQPYFFNFHATSIGENSFGEKAIANTMVIGKSGTGKTALINFLLSQVQKYQPKPTIFFFDKDRGAEIFIRACGGSYMALENGKPTGFNPFQCEENDTNLQFLCNLTKLLCAKEKYSAQDEEDVLRAVKAMLSTPKHLRSISNLQKSMPNKGEDGLYAALRKWTTSGSLGWVFDNPRDLIDFDNANIVGFDYTDLIDNEEVRTPVINYLIHRMESLIDGRRFIYVMDEFWKILSGEGGLKEFAKNKQKTIRKQNGLGIFATQSPEDALKSDIAAALIEQTATLILLPNPNADRADYIDGLKLSEAEFAVVCALGERSRSFMVKQGHASAICKLDLNGMDNELAVISSSTDNIDIMQKIIHNVARDKNMTKQINTETEAKTASLNNIHPDEWLKDFYQQRKGSGKPAT